LGTIYKALQAFENGSTTPLGVYISYLPYLNLIDSFRNSDGSTLLNANLNVVAHNAIFQTMTKTRILGAAYGLTFILPVVNTRLQANVFDSTFQSAGMSDWYFAPVILGWSKGKTEYVLNYGFYAPTGNFDPNRAVNQGLGFGNIRCRRVRRTPLTKRNSRILHCSLLGRSIKVSLQRSQTWTNGQF